MIKLLRRISEWGIRSDTPAIQANHFRLTNVLLFVLTIGSLFWTAILFASGAIEAALINSTAPLVFAGGLLLMRAGYTKAARLLVITISYACGYLIVTIIGPASYFQLIFLFASAFSVVFFSIEEKWCLIYGVFSALGAYTTLEITNYKPILGFERVAITEAQYQMMRFNAAILIWIMMLGHFANSIRQRRRSEEQLVSSSKMVAMGRMAAGIAHEVNNPLQKIVVHAEKLKAFAASGKVTADQVSVFSEQIQDVAMRIGSIVKGLLVLSRDSSGDPFTDVPVHSILNLSLDYCRSRLEANNVEIKLGEVPKRWTVLAREAQISEVLLNVLNNAFDSVMEASQRWIQVDVASVDQWIEIAVSDSGPGINPKIRHKIFDPFFTTKPIGKGTGLGLSISHSIVAAHGGEIYLDPSSVRTRFVVRLPRGRDI